MKKSALSPCRPYLLRAYYEWLLDNHLTPCLVIDATYPGVQVPLEHVNDGKIVLNVAPQSVTHFELERDAVSFNTCFGGVPCQITVPMAAVLAVYARENSAGTLFEEEPAYRRSVALAADRFVAKSIVETSQDSDNSSVSTSVKSPGRRPSLHIVK